MVRGKEALFVICIILLVASVSGITWSSQGTVLKNIFDQELNTTENVTFNNLNLTGDLLVNDITANDITVNNLEVTGNFTANTTIDSDLLVQGNLTVLGDTHLQNVTFDNATGNFLAVSSTTLCIGTVCINETTGKLTIDGDVKAVKYEGEGFITGDLLVLKSANISVNLTVFGRTELKELNGTDANFSGLVIAQEFRGKYNGTSNTPYILFNPSNTDVILLR